VHGEKAKQLSRTPSVGFPWLSIGIAAAAVAVAIMPALREALLYDRAQIATGQWWRLWSGHLAHHGARHLFWNLAVFIPSAIWLERLWPRTARSFLAISPLFISACLLGFEPTLKIYAGLSGVTVGVLALLALLQLRNNAGEPRWFWAAILALIAIKIGVEFLRPATAFFAGLPPGVRNVPWAHLAGALGASLFALPAFRRRQPSVI
jgi:rhomboid family GlyGly-CTERM serine protease